MINPAGRSGGRLPRRNDTMQTSYTEPRDDIIDDDVYALDTQMTSIVSYPERCRLWGSARFRGTTATDASSRTWCSDTAPPELPTP